MPALPAHRELVPMLLAAALSAGLIPASPAWAQVRIQFNVPQGIFLNDSAGPVELTPPRVDVISGATANRLEQVRALVKQNNWDDAVDILRELIAGAEDRVVALDEHRFVDLRTYCQLQLAQMPADALVAYRRRVDAAAERLVRDGVAARDESLLRRVVDEMFASSWADDALLVLGEIALERGDYAAARRNWEQINPLTRDPAGRSLWISLHGVDLGAHWPEVERRWVNRDNRPTWLAYPDSNIDLADVRALLILASIRAGELDRAAVELDAFRRWHPEAAGRLGGQVGPYVESLEKIMASAKEWPPTAPNTNWLTFAGAASRSSHGLAIGALGRTAWPRPLALASTGVVRNSIPWQAGALPEESVRESQQPISCFPVIDGKLLLYADAMTVRAADLATGEPAITKDGVLYHAELSNGAGRRQDIAQTNAASGVPRHTLTVVDGVVYARVGRVETSSLENPRRSTNLERIVGLDLRRDGLLTFQVRPDDDAWSFDGTPLADGRYVYVAMRHSDVTSRAYVACFDAASGRRVWRTSIGAADTPASGRGAEITSNLLSLVGDRIYFNTNLGLVASLRTNDGRIQWIHEYQRRTGDKFLPGPTAAQHFARDPSPCMVQDGMAVVAPSDAPTVFALDADTGQSIWSSDKLADALQLVGVAGDRLIVSGNRLSWVDLYSGGLQSVWPESEHAGIRGIGRGCLAGNEIFWPARKEVYVFDAQTGARTRPPIDLGPVSANGANVCAGQGFLVVTSRDRLLATGPTTAAGPTESKNIAPKVAESN